MRTILLLTLALLTLSPFTVCAETPTSEPQTQDTAGQAAPENANPVRADYDLIKEAYGGDIGPLTEETPGHWVFTARGKKIAMNGGTVTENIVSSDMALTLTQPYNLEPDRTIPAAGVNPGRNRCYDFFTAMYGADKKEVLSQIVNVKFLGRNVPFSKNGGAAAALRRVAAELEAAAAKDPGLKPLLIPDGGFYWRRIAGETCLSPHSFGIAIDLNTKYATYWKWQKNPDAPHPQQTSYPSVIVKAFEDNGFIWGGKWHRFDIMHFEYRPEIILQAKKKAVEAEPCVPVRESRSGAEKKESAPLPE